MIKLLKVKMALTKRGTYILQPKSHFSDVMRALNEQRKRRDKTVCDVILSVEGTIAVAHKAVLAACSSYFKQHFMEGKENQTINQSKSRNQTTSYSNTSLPIPTCQSIQPGSPPTKRRKTVSESIPESSSLLSSPLAVYPTSTPPPEPIRRKVPPPVIQRYEASSRNIVTLPGIKAKALHQILDYMYSSTIHINEENIQDLLLVSCLLQVRPVMDACTKILSKEARWGIAPDMNQPRKKTPLRPIVRQQSDVKESFNFSSATRKNGGQIHAKSEEKRDEGLLNPTEGTNKNSTNEKKPAGPRRPDSDTVTHIGPFVDEQGSSEDTRVQQTKESDEEKTTLLPNENQKDIKISPLKLVKKSDENRRDKEEAEPSCCETQIDAKTAQTVTQSKKKETTTEEIQQSEAKENLCDSDCSKYIVLDLRQKRSTACDSNNGSLQKKPVDSDHTVNEKRAKRANNLSLQNPTTCLVTPISIEPKKQEIIQPKQSEYHGHSISYQNVPRMKKAESEVFLGAPPPYNLSPPNCLPAPPLLTSKSLDPKFLLEPPRFMHSNENSNIISVPQNYSNQIKTARAGSLLSVSDLTKPHVDPFRTLPFGLWPLLPETFPYFNPGLRPTFLNCAPPFLPQRDERNLEKLQAFSKFSAVPLHSSEPYALMNPGPLGNLSRQSSEEAANSYMRSYHLKSVFHDDMGFRANSIESSSFDSSSNLIPRASIAPTTQFKSKNMTEKSPTSRRRQCVV